MVPRALSFILNFHILKFSYWIKYFFIRRFLAKTVNLAPPSFFTRALFLSPAAVSGWRTWEKEV